MSCFTLKPNWSLLDSSFESYKLSLQQLPIYSVKLDVSPYVVTQEADDFSYQRTKVISMHNYLVCDPWNESSCYYVDSENKVNLVYFSVETSLPKPKVLFQLEPRALQGSRRMPVSMSFPSSDLCLLVDDTGQACLVNTGDRTVASGQKWRAVFNGNLSDGDTSPVMVLQSRQRNDESASHSTIDIFTLKFQDKEDHTDVIVEWMTLVPNKNLDKWSIDERKLFKGSHVPFFLAFGKKGNMAHIGCQSKLKFMPNWDQESTEDVMDVDDESSEYNWRQTDEDLTINITLPPGVTKTSVICNILSKSIEIGIKSAENETRYLVQGELYDNIDQDLSDWTISNNILEVSLQKKDEGRRWDFLISGDFQKEIVDGLPTTDVRGLQPTGLDRYEDCDDLPDADSMLYCFDGSTNTITHEASLSSNQWLFNAYYGHEHCAVLRHDVDALMWICDGAQPSSECPWSHVATFNALGYVKASKQDVKFSSCPSNVSYAALCESVRRIFVYHTSTACSAPLRNRVTGKQAHISKQQVVTLPSNDLIFGFHASNDMIFVLTKTELLVVKVYAPES